MFVDGISSKEEMTQLSKATRVSAHLSDNEMLILFINDISFQVALIIQLFLLC